jgi:pyridoxamine 5'-phosphate oxidase
MNTHSSNTNELYQEAITRLRDLIAEAKEAGDREPTAMALATADGNGRVSSRIVLLKAIDTRGLHFFSNYESHKAAQLAAHPQAAVTFHWKTLRDQVQVRVEGSVSRLSEAESDAYFATRPRMSQIGAWASMQSQVLPSREVFDQRVAKFEDEFADAPVPRPPHWGGYLLAPDRFEFWYGAQYRLHDRVVYQLRDRVWNNHLLYP